MDSLIKIMTKSNKFNDYLKDIKDKKFPLSLTGLTDVAKVHMSYATSFYLNKPFIIITYNEIQAKKLIKDLQYFNSNVLSFPKKEILTYDVEAESKQISNIRLNALNSILKGENPIIVTTIEAINQRIIAKQDLSKDVFEINLNSDYDLEDIKQKLVNLGFERTDLVEGKGQFSVRGGIIDIAPVESDNGIRIELWGDSVDSIRHFDIESQRSIDNIDSITIYPVTEFLLTDSLENICENILSKEYT